MIIYVSLITDASVSLIGTICFDLLDSEIVYQIVLTYRYRDKLKLSLLF